MAHRTVMKMLLVAASAWALCATALACPPPPPPPPYPPPPPLIEGELAVDYLARAAAYGAAIDAERAERDAQRIEAVRSWQARAWEEAEQVFVAQIESSRLAAGPRDLESYYPDGARVARVRLSPVRWLKGHSRTRAFELSVDGFTSCGPSMWPAVQAAAGEKFIVFARQGAVRGSRDILHMIAYGDLLDPDLRRIAWSTSGG